MNLQRRNEKSLSLFVNNHHGQGDSDFNRTFNRVIEHTCIFMAAFVGVGYGWILLLFTAKENVGGTNLDALATFDTFVFVYHRRHGSRSFHYLKTHRRGDMLFDVKRIVYGGVKVLVDS
jgi:hypothetical protein